MGRFTAYDNIKKYLSVYKTVKSTDIAYRIFSVIYAYYTNELKVWTDRLSNISASLMLSS